MAEPHCRGTTSTALVTGSTSGIGAAIATRLAADGFPEADLDAMLAVNARAPHVLVGTLVPSTRSVVDIGSWMARVGTPYGAMSTATKAALEQLIRAWSAEHGPQGVRVVTVAPGATLTEGKASARAVLDAMTARTPAGVVVQPDDVAAAVSWVVSDATRMVQGTVVSVGGGISATRPAWGTTKAAPGSPGCRLGRTSYGAAG